MLVLFQMMKDSDWFVLVAVLVSVCVVQVESAINPGESSFVNRAEPKVPGKRTRQGVTLKLDSCFLGASLGYCCCKRRKLKQINGCDVTPSNYVTCRD